MCDEKVMRQRAFWRDHLAQYAGMHGFYDEAYRPVMQRSGATTPAGCIGSSIIGPTFVDSIASSTMYWVLVDGASMAVRRVIRRRILARKLARTANP